MKSLNLKNLMGGAFGKVDNVVLTMNGLGFKAKDGNISVYDKTTKTITKVPEEFVIGDIPVYAIPATDVKEGDLVLHNDFLKIYLGKSADGVNHKVINIKTQEVQELIPAKNLFGFGVFSKVISPFGDFGAGALGSAEGGLNSNAMLMLALLGDKDGEDGDSDGIDPIMLMAMSGGLGGAGGQAGGFNPLMLLALKSKF